MTASDFRVTLLGTGTPVPSPDRFGPCTLVEAGDQKFLIDAGHGATIQLYQLKLPIGRIDVQPSLNYGAGADLLLHEVASAPPELMKQAYIQRIIGHHTTPREAGLVFAQTKPKLAAYTHIALLGTERIPPPTVDDVVAETRKTYSGPLVVGEDLMAFEIGETVLVRRLQLSSPPTDNASVA